MFVRSTVVRAAVAGLSALALAATASPALAGTAGKPATPATGSLSPHGGATPLENGVEQSFTGTQQYVYDQEFIYWSVTAVRSDGGKPTLSLYDDEAGTTLLAKSALKKKQTEFVVVDSNHAAVPASYFPKAKSKGGASTIEVDNDAEILFDATPIDVPMGEGDVVKSVDVFLTVGETYELKVSGDGDSALFLMTSDVEDPTSWYKSRADADFKADKKGAGKAEKIVVEGDDDWHALILINNSGDGTYTLLKTVL